MYLAVRHTSMMVSGSGSIQQCLVKIDNPPPPSAHVMPSYVSTFF